MQWGVPQQHESEGQTPSAWASRKTSRTQAAGGQEVHIERRGSTWVGRAESKKKGRCHRRVPCDVIVTSAPRLGVRAGLRPRCVGSPSPA